MKKRVMEMAWTIYKKRNVVYNAHNCSFSDCLRTAWANVKNNEIEIMLQGQTLNINLVDGSIGGETYKARGAIKAHFNAKWKADRKVWVADSAKILDEVLYYAHWIELVKTSTKGIEPKKHTDHDVNGICPLCGTWCYGDCTA